MFRVSEEVRFCYGHRLMAYVGRCARVHGHNARVEVVLSAETLDHQGFVTDFGAVEAAARDYIDETLDHRLLLRDDDPLVPVLQRAGEVFVSLPCNPTAENLARMIYDHLSAKGFPVSSVRFWETESSLAVYEG